MRLKRVKIIRFDGCYLLAYHQFNEISILPGPEWSEVWSPNSEFRKVIDWKLNEKIKLQIKWLSNEACSTYQLDNIALHKYNTPNGGQWTCGYPFMIRTDPYSPRPLSAFQVWFQESGLCFNQNHNQNTSFYRLSHFSLTSVFTFFTIFYFFILINFCLVPRILGNISFVNFSPVARYARARYYVITNV